MFDQFKKKGVEGVGGEKQAEEEMWMYLPHRHITLNVAN